MSWDYREHDLREQNAFLKSQLAVQDAKVARFEDETLRYKGELEEVKEALQVTCNKLRNEESQVLQLEDSLKRRSEDYQREKIDRENRENALRNSEKELKELATTIDQLQALISDLSRDNDGSREQQSKVVQEKAKLEVRVKELDSELRILRSQKQPQQAPPSRRPRSSSLTNFKVVSLEQDLAQATLTSSESRAELDRVKQRLSQMQTDLVKLENEKSVLEKKISQKDQVLEDVKEDLALKDEELTYLRSHGGDGDQEALMARLEEEEATKQLLEQQLQRESREVEVLRQRTQRAEAELTVESTRREKIEAELNSSRREKEQAAQKWQEAECKVRDMVEELKEKEKECRESEKSRWSLRDELYAAKCKQSPVMDDDTMYQLNATISRIRNERDEARRRLEYIQMESRFAPRSLQEGDCTRSITSSIDDAKGSRHACHLNLTISALGVALQHLQSQNEHMLERLGHQRFPEPRKEYELDTLHAEWRTSAETYSLAAAETERHMALLQRNLEDKINLLSEADERYTLLCTVESSLRNDVQLMHRNVQSISAERDDLKQKVSSLEEAVQSMQLNVNDAEERYSQLLQEQRIPSSDSLTASLRSQIKELEGRVMRRTEQIGVHQHDIKRLETNMRLAEDRLSEISSELEMASMQNEAMVEDCQVARDERDEAKTAVAELEITQEELMRQLGDKVSVVDQLRVEVRSLEESACQSDALRVEELATMVLVVADKSLLLQASLQRLRRCEARAVDAQSLLHKTNERLSQRDDELELVKEERDATKRFNEQLQQTAGSSDEFTSALNARLQEATTESDALREQILSLEDAVRSGSSEVEMLRRTLDETRNLHDSQVRKLNQELVDRTAELGIRTSFADELERDLEKERKDRDALLDKANSDLAESKLAIQTLEAQIQEAAVCSAEVGILKQELVGLRRELEAGNTLVNSLEKELNKQRSESADVSNKVHAELEEARATLQSLKVQSRQAMTSSAEEITKLQDHVSSLLLEIDGLHASLEDQLEKHNTESSTLKGEVREANERCAELRTSEEELTRKLGELHSVLNGATESYALLRSEIEEVRTNRDILSGEQQRATLRCQSAETQLLLSQDELRALRVELEEVRIQLSQSEKSGKTAEMNLLLLATEHQTTVASLKQRLVDFGKAETRFEDIVRSNNELRELVDEKEQLLQSKCAEIEESDDKIIELLKEKKKLASKVDSLSRKLGALQIKFKASKPPSPSSSSSTTPPVLRSSSNELQSRHDSLPAVKKVPSLPFKERTVEIVNASEPLPELPISAQTPLFSKTMVVTPPTSSVSKKRRAPDDDDIPSLPPAVVMGESMVSSDRATDQAGPSNTTPRFRRQLQAIRSGFTPTRTQGLRPATTQVSPSRKSNVFVLPSVARDTASKSPRRAISISANPSQKPPSRGWLGKIRGGTGNPVNLNFTRSSAQSSVESLVQ